MKNYSIRYTKFKDQEIPTGLHLESTDQLFDHFIHQVHTPDYYNEIVEIVNNILTGKTEQYIFEHNDVYLTVQKDITSTRVEYLQDQYPEGQAPKEEYYAEISTLEFLEILNFWWTNYDEYLKQKNREL